MAKKRIVKDSDGNTVELDQDKIEAALAGAVSMSNGAAIQQRREPAPAPAPAPAPTPAPVPTDDQAGKKVKTNEDGRVDDEKSVALRKFGEACFNLTIDAKQCFEASSQYEDGSVTQYIRSINKKIYDEVQKGGYSTNVVFRVAPQDWVNVNHIMDWYRARGFQILNYETTSEPYGKNVGTVCYNFCVSWASAQA